MKRAAAALIGLLALVLQFGHSSAAAGVLSDFSNFTPNGVATISSDKTSATLTDGTFRHAGSVFNPSAQPIGGGFTAQFTYLMTPSATDVNGATQGSDTYYSPADGFAFVLQNSAQAALAIGACSFCQRARAKKMTKAQRSQSARKASLVFCI